MRPSTRSRASRRPGPRRCSPPPRRALRVAEPPRGAALVPWSSNNSSACSRSIFDRSASPAARNTPASATYARPRSPGPTESISSSARVAARAASRWRSSAMSSACFFDRELRIVPKAEIAAEERAPALEQPQGLLAVSRLRPLHGRAGGRPSRRRRRSRSARGCRALGARNGSPAAAPRASNEAATATRTPGAEATGSGDDSTMRITDASVRSAAPNSPASIRAFASRTANRSSSTEASAARASSSARVNNAIDVSSAPVIA